MHVIRMLAAVVVLVLMCGPVAAETILCESITSVPAILSRPGIYCLKGNVTAGHAAAPAIFITAENVVLDLNEWSLSAGPNSRATGVASSQGSRNVTVRNGTIAGFRVAVAMLGDNHVVEGVRVDHATEGGIEALGDSNIIRDNHVVGIHRTEGLAWGIYVMGRRNVIVNNDVADITAPDDNGVGIDLSNFSGTGTDFLALNNRISCVREGIRFEHGATGKYRDNLTTGVTTPFVGGTDAGNNQ